MPLDDLLLPRLKTMLNSVSFLLLLTFTSLTRSIHNMETNVPIYLNFSGENGVVEPKGKCHYHNCETDEIVVQFKNKFSNDDEIRRIGEEHGYSFEGRVGELDAYRFKRKDGRRVKRHAFQPIFNDPSVEWAEVQFPKIRVKRDFKEVNKLDPVKLPWPDPLYTKQWYLRAGAMGGFDMKVREAWKLGYSGKNIVVSILDDGVQGSHPDLIDNYDPLASTDINSGDDDPTPRNNGDNKHGTRCAGEVASMAGNAWCGVGIAYNAKIGGVRMLDGPVSDRVEGAALAHHQNHIDIYSASWGPDDDGQTFDGPGSLAKMAFFQGVTKGRKGKGNIFIWASGNGGSYQDSCSCDGYTTSIYTLSVSSATFDNRQPWYLEECPSTLCTTYSSASRGQPAIISTDMPNTCTEQHTGTSASAPIAAAIVALALEANGNLTWRDMQHLVIRTSNPTPLLDNPGWAKNAVGRMVSNKFGYGLMNAEALVKVAKNWKIVPPHRVCTFSHKTLDPDFLKGRFVKNYTLYVSGRCLHTSVLYLEHVQSLVSIQFKRRGDLHIILTSPRGTRSVLLPSRPRDDFRSGFQKWPFMSVQQWGENPEGYWTLTVQNVGTDMNTGTFHDWSLTLYGTDVPTQPGDESQTLARFDSPVTDGDNNHLDPSAHPLPPPPVGQPIDQSDSSAVPPHNEVEFPRQAHLRQSPPLDGVGGRAGAPVKEAFFNNGDGGVGEGPVGAPLTAASMAGNSGAFHSQSSVLLFGDGRAKILHSNCHKECSVDGCYIQNSAQDCVTCKNLKQFLRNKGGAKCVEQCDNGYYTDLEAKRCNQCLNGCATCSSAEYCATCPQGTLLVDIDPEHFHHGRCAARCPEGFVNATDNGRSMKCVAICGMNCLTCKDHTQCRYCKENFYMSPARQCLTTCPEGFFANKETRKCEDCLPQCNKCKDKAHCLECSFGYAWNNTLSVCDLEQRKSCQENKDCPTGQYCESSDFYCQVCHTDCIDCIGPAFDQCTSCRNGQPMDSRTKQCLPCHAGQYFNAITGDCSPCEKSCAVCVGASRTQCTKCNKGHKQLGSLCEPCCTKSNSMSHGIYCVTCLDQTDQDSAMGILLPKSTNQLVRIIVGLVVAGVLFSVLLMVFLMCRDRNYTLGAKKYAYSKIPMISDADLGENKSLLKADVSKTKEGGASNGDSNNNNNAKYRNLEEHLLEGSSEDEEEENEQDHVFFYEPAGQQRQTIDEEHVVTKSDHLGKFVYEPTI